MNRTLLSIGQFVEKHKHQTEPSLRWLVFNESHNGFSKVIRRIGKRVFIDEEAYFQWVDEQNKVA